MSEIPFPMLVGLGIVGLVLARWLWGKAQWLLNRVRAELFTASSLITAALYVAMVYGGVLLAVQFQVHVMGVDPTQAVVAQTR